MKKIVKFIVVLFAIQIVAIPFASAQKLKTSEVPSEVSQAIDFQYPYVKVIGWQMEGSSYVATFKDEGSVGKAYISKKGEWERTTYDIKKDEIPSSITEYVNKNYPDFIVSLACLEEKEDVALHYYIEVKPDGVGFKPSKLTFNDKGVLMKREDPADFKDPLAPAPEKVPVKPAEKDPKQPAAKPVASTNKPSMDKPKEPAKPVAKPAPAPKPEAKPKQEPVKKEAKPAPQKPVETKPAADKSKAPEAKPKKEKPEKPEPIIKDEQGNVALKLTAVPEAVKKALPKKVMHPEELNWFLIDSSYVAKCYNTGKKTAVYFTKNGVWEKMLTVLPEESVTGPMLKHLNDYYKGFKFKNAVKEQRADKNDKTMVEFYEKANYKSKLVTTVIFDKTGKLIRTIDPDYQLENAQRTSDEDEALEKYYEKMNMSLSNDDARNVPENIQAVFKLKYPKATNVEWKEDNMNYQAHYYTTRGKETCVINSLGTIVETWLLGKPDNLSTTIQDYIKKEHKGCKVVEYYSVKKIADKVNLYKVLIQNKKTMEETELWFNTAGRPVNM